MGYHRQVYHRNVAPWTRRLPYRIYLDGDPQARKDGMTIQTARTKAEALAKENPGVHVRVKRKMGQNDNCYWTEACCIFWPTEGLSWA